VVHLFDDLGVLRGSPHRSLNISSFASLSPFPLSASLRLIWIGSDRPSHLAQHFYKSEIKKWKTGGNLRADAVDDDKVSSMKLRHSAMHPQTRVRLSREKVPTHASPLAEP
jgi:hypothetical protein